MVYAVGSVAAVATAVIAPPTAPLVGAAAASASVALPAAAVLVASGPAGWVILGTSATQQEAEYTFDCWKPLLHDDSPLPSSGMLLREVVMDSRIKNVTLNQQSNEFVLENIWNERFRVDFVSLATGQQAAHAVLLN